MKREKCVSRNRRDDVVIVAFVGSARIRRARAPNGAKKRVFFFAKIRETRRVALKTRLVS
jgi:hypothetical protein